MQTPVDLLSELSPLLADRALGHAVPSVAFARDREDVGREATARLLARDYPGVVGLQRSGLETMYEVMQPEFQDVVQLVLETAAERHRQLPTPLDAGDLARLSLACCSGPPGSGSGGKAIAAKVGEARPAFARLLSLPIMNAVTMSIEAARAAAQATHEPDTVMRGLGWTLEGGRWFKVSRQSMVFWKSSVDFARVYIELGSMWTSTVNLVYPEFGLVIRGDSFGDPAIRYFFVRRGTRAEPFASIREALIPELISRFPDAVHDVPTMWTV